MRDVNLHEAYSANATLMQEVAALLPDGPWTVNCDDADGNPCHVCKLINEAGVGMVVHVDVYDERLRFEPRLHKDARGQVVQWRQVVHTDLHPPSGTVSSRLGAKRIARDIELRLYNKIKPHWHGILDWYEHDAQKHRALLEVATKLNALLATMGGASCNPPLDSNQARTTGSFKLFTQDVLFDLIEINEGGYVSLRIRSVAMERLPALLELVHGFKRTSDAS